MVVTKINFGDNKKMYWNGENNNFNETGKGGGVRGGLVTNKIFFERFFTREGKDPFKYDLYGNPIKWISEDVAVSDDEGKVIFLQPAVKRPELWSSLAIKVVASRYFWGELAKGERESSVEHLIGRVSKYIGRQAIKHGYLNEEQANVLRDEIVSVCLNQLAAFNSPVWFNAGIQEYDANAGGVSAYKWDFENKTVVKTNKTDDSPQCSACFIQSIKDDMDSIMEVQVAEANLFKAGSGTGTNRSTLRSSKETLTGGGRASGPVSFMRGYDAYAGIIKSGGKTRRAAKMEILNIDHPDIMDFINAKSNEEKKAWALIEQGFTGGLNGEAYKSIAFQNCNMSVRATDDFMNVAIANGEWSTKFVKTKEVCETFKARDVLNKIAEGTYICGDPGMQFDSTFNKWNTCKNSGRINATNPCSEYAFLDDSACNLASINLIKFLTADGKFDVEKFRAVVKAFILSMELFVDGASYPTEKITKNSHDFRPLGLGYANLGALLMALGLPYDSDAGRAVTATITAIMCGEAYKMSAEMAAAVGPFPAFEKNREPMLEVMKMHREAVKEINVETIPSELRYLVNDAWDSWTDAIELGKIHGYRNAQTTVLAPTGTIGFMMNCTTTGIEPAIALVSYKVLSGGGMLKIVNSTVPLGLRTLGYNDEQIKEIIEYLDKNETIEDSPYLKEEHLPVFDCAFRALKGKRSIHYKGHIKMMGAVQPFLSGAISKTINMPEDATVEEIAQAYIFSWEQGLKAVAIYRENSKRAQPLTTQKTKGEIVKKTEIARIGQRIKLPQTRKSITHKFEIAGHEGYLTVGMYDDGKPGEVFVTMHKQGSTIRGLIDAWATSVSLNLQYGASVSELFTKFRHQKFEPAGFVKNNGSGEMDEKIKQIKTASSIVDYVAQFMLNNFGDGAGGVETSRFVPKPNLDGFKTLGFDSAQNSQNFDMLKEPEHAPDFSPKVLDIAIEKFEDNKEEQASLEKFEMEGITCPICGGPAKRIGNCSIMCMSCKQTTRKGCGE